MRNKTHGLLTWDDIFHYFYLYQVDEELYNNKFRVLLGGNLEEDVTDSNYYGYVLAAMNSCHIPRVREQANKVFDIFNLSERKKNLEKKNYKTDVSLYLSFYPSASSHGIHRDAADVFHWQQVGYAKWTVYDTGKQEHILSPGDCIYVPTGMYHSVVPLTARAGITFGFFPPDYGKETAESYILRKNLVFPYYNPFLKDS